MKKDYMLYSKEGKPKARFSGQLFQRFQNHVDLRPKIDSDEIEGVRWVFTGEDAAYTVGVHEEQMTMFVMTGDFFIAIKAVS